MTAMKAGFNLVGYFTTLEGARKAVWVWYQPLNGHRADVLTSVTDDQGKPIMQADGFPSGLRDAPTGVCLSVDPVSGTISDAKRAERIGLVAV